ncbi:SDR family NAD(P)-dependent oxidoreductase [Paraflavitalea pollutisoli]|uniref:SDR family NAD(P)-dependent oxidoreductase n=1 Tax=Paraflavitalea pollutisoli TaxID=3034143 RepID=UPI0023EE184A|nr:SDR family oxidoreductase [Paraflavitalea sp. H1-2-19X]
MSTTNKIALVTGGSRGLGKNAALTLAKKGIHVILTYRSKKEEADAVVADIRQMGLMSASLRLDVGESHTFDAFFAELTSVLKDQFGRGQFDFLVNNAGIDGTSPIATTSEQLFDDMFHVHLKGTYFVTQKALPLLADGGRIINFSSGLARFAIPGYSAYAAMKGGIEVFTRYLAKELGSRNITANTIAPGPVETDFTRHSLGNPQIRNVLVGQTALGRTGQPDDIGGVIAFLCSPEAAWITAQRIEVSGGIFL